MRVLDRQSAEELLSIQGVRPSELGKILSGFNFGKPIYEQDFWPGDVLFQLIRLPSAVDPDPLTGNWFGLPGMTSANVAINDGISGRRLASFIVVSPFKALEGMAAPLKVNVGSGIGGAGGATQIYVPRSLFPCLSSRSPVDRY